MYGLINIREEGKEIWISMYVGRRGREEQRVDWKDEWMHGWIDAYMSGHPEARSVSPGGSPLGSHYLAGG